MSVKHHIFLPHPVRHDLSNLNNPEIEFVEAIVEESFRCEPQTEKIKAQSQEFKRLVIEWAYFIHNKTNGKELLYFGGKDNYDVLAAIPDDFDHDDLITQSHQRFRNHFDQLDLIDNLRELEEDEISHIRKKLVKHLIEVDRQK